MTVAALFIQRDCAGGAITGLRLFHLRGSASWQVPHLKRATEDPLSTITAAADWTAEQIKNAPDGASSQLTVVLDAQGSTCQWLAAPSSDDAAIKATVRDALTAGPDDEGGASLSWLADAAPGADTSVQGLADVAVLDVPQDTGKQRLALVSVADLPARVLLDELDKRDIVVRRVCSAWHAMALAWDPSAKDQRTQKPDDDRVVAASEPVGAVVTIDPSGLLTWSWSQRGTLIAGGTLLLRKDQARIGDEPEAPSGPGLRIAGSEPQEQDPRPTVSVIEVVRSDIGRLASDWLGWSVQLGVAPARIAIVGPSSVTCAGIEFDLPDMLGVAAVGAGLGRHWPGASVHATIDEDATGKTVQRLMDMENGVGPGSAPTAAVDPRLSLTELSSRPGAADRKLHRWAGLALLIAAAAVAVIGWRVGRTISDVQAQVFNTAEQQNTLLKSVAFAAPAAAKDDDPALILKSKRIEMEKARADQKDEEPIVAEMQRVLVVLAQVKDVRLKTLQINSLGILSRFELSVPIDGDQGPRVKELLTDTRSGATREIKWDGKHIRTANTERRDWNMAGAFADAPKNAPKQPAPTVPAQDPKPPASPMLDSGPGAEPAPTPAPSTEDPAAVPETPTPKTDPKPEPAQPAAPPPAEPKKEAHP